MERRDAKYLPLAAVGLAQGAYKYYVEPQITAERAWLGLGAAILAYEIACPQDHLLSQGVDRAIEKHPVATRLAIGITALHLANALPRQLDPFYQLTKNK